MFFIAIFVMVAVGFYGCSTTQKASESYGPAPEQLMGPMPPITPLKEGEEYGPVVQKEKQFGVILVLGSIPQAPGIAIGALRQIESEGILVKKIIAIETSALMAGIHSASESSSKSDWNLTQIYKDLEKSEKKSLQKKLEKIFLTKSKSRSPAEITAVAKSSNGWVTHYSPELFSRISGAIRGCGWVDDLGEWCIKSTTKEAYLDLIKNETTQPVLVIEREIPTEQQENRFFLQMPEPAVEPLDASSRSKHLFLGKKGIKQEIEKIKEWIKTQKEKSESS